MTDFTGIFNYKKYFPVNVEKGGSWETLRKEVSPNFFLKLKMTLSAQKVS